MSDQRIFNIADSDRGTAIAITAGGLLKEWTVPGVAGMTLIEISPHPEIRTIRPQARMSRAIFFPDRSSTVAGTSMAVRRDTTPADRPVPLWIMRPGPSNNDGGLPKGRAVVGL
jgi:hypothetical protein